MSQIIRRLRNPKTGFFFDMYINIIRLASVLIGVDLVMDLNIANQSLHQKEFKDLMQIIRKSCSGFLNTI